MKYGIHLAGEGNEVVLREYPDKLDLPLHVTVLPAAHVEGLFSDRMVDGTRSFYAPTRDFHELAVIIAQDPHNPSLKGDTA